MKEAPGIHLNMAGKTISIQKSLLQLYEERSNEQKKWIDLLAGKINALEKTYGAQFIWKIDHYQVEKSSYFYCLNIIYLLGKTCRSS